MERQGLEADATTIVIAYYKAFREIRNRLANRRGTTALMEPPSPHREEARINVDQKLKS
jgi:hypothetical protein